MSLGNLIHKERDIIGFNKQYMNTCSMLLYQPWRATPSIISSAVMSRTSATTSWRHYNYNIYKTIVAENRKDRI